MKRGPKATRATVLVILLSLVTSGCSTSKPAADDIIGVWTERGSAGSGESKCGTIQFNDDGTFLAQGIPSAYIAPSMWVVPERFTASGLWTLDTSARDQLAVHRILLHFDPSGVFPSQFESVLYISVGGGLLYAGVDANLRFKRDAPCVS